MSRPTKHEPERGDAKTRLLDAALRVVRQKGFAATSVEDLCLEAGVTKGAYFHHFKTKEALGLAAVEHWGETTSALFEAAPYHELDDPLQRVLAYLDLRRSMIRGELWQWTCLAGTMAQEVYDSNRVIRDGCAASILGHAATLETDIAAAMKLYDIKCEWSAASLARHTQVVLQGAFILAKASGDKNIALQSIDHLKSYIELIFRNSGTETTTA